LLVNGTRVPSRNAPVTLSHNAFATANHEAGFYEAPFDLLIFSGDPGYEIVYTIDGSNPQKSSAAIHSSATVTVRVDLSLSADLSMTPVFIVRASLGMDGYTP
jgi:hypothetical protein